MKIIDISVINQDTSKGFAYALMEAVEELQEKGLEVTINNPHLVTGEGGAGVFNYVAVVEGREFPRGAQKMNEGEL